jgi:hypothetical protein
VQQMRLCCTMCKCGKRLKLQQLQQNPKGLLQLLQFLMLLCCTEKIIWKTLSVLMNECGIKKQGRGKYIYSGDPEEPLNDNL